MPPPLPLPPFPFADLVIIFALVVLNGVFAMSELAIVSARRPRLQALANAGKQNALVVLKLQEDPGRFLSSVQIGITSIGVLAGAYSGEALGGPFAAYVRLLGFSAATAENIGFTLAIVGTTYVSLIIGELVPKQIALRNPEPVALLAAPPMMLLAKIAAPLVWLLDASTNAIFRLIGLRRESQEHVTAEELHLIVAEASKSGVIEESERAIISGVVRLADQPVRTVMTPRTDVDWIDVDADVETVRQALLATPHTRLPVAEGHVEAIIGIVQARDVMTTLLRGDTLDLRALSRPVAIVPDQVDAMDALETLRKADVPMVMVHDEYGHFEGIVTPADLLSSIAGEFASDLDLYDEPNLVERDDGSFLVSGQMPVDSLADRLDIALPEDRDYATVAGFALWAFKRLPQLGEYFEDQDWRFEIADLDGRKIDKLLVTRVRDQAD